MSNDGAGFELLTPKPETKNYIIHNDKTFAKQVASHNATCRVSAACIRITK